MVLRGNSCLTNQDSRTRKKRVPLLETLYEARMKPWSEIKHEFDADGSLREIYVDNIEPEGRDQFIAEIKGSQYEIDIYHGDLTVELPRSLVLIKRLQERDPAALRSEHPEKIQINCQSFVETEIELD